jgi:hypothetical protein
MALQRLSNMVKARLPESQYPAVELSHLSVARLQPDAIRSHGFNSRPWYVPAGER